MEVHVGRFYFPEFSYMNMVPLIFEWLVQVCSLSSSSCVASTMNIINATERLKMRLRLSLGVKKLYNILPNEVDLGSIDQLHGKYKEHYQYNKEVQSRS
uniref:Uncharacterized protein n=1 Tax=Aegilops tauschii TaxID=37682 RepID=M8D1N3_AEGTA